MKIKVVASIVGAILLLSCGFYYSSAVSASNKEYRTFVGGVPSKETSSKKAAYQKERKEVLKNRSEKLPNENVEATVTFTDFLSPAEVQKLMGKYPSIEIKRVWYWFPGEDGRAMSQVTERNIKKSIDEAVQRFQETKPDGSAKETINKLISNLGVFSISVKGKYIDLETMSNEEVIKLIDVHYKEEIEKKQKKQEKKLVILNCQESRMEAVKSNIMKKGDDNKTSAFLLK
ncbi:hypothetical protein ACFO25_03955 [Paenactinomyces guangxiensis]|uniref:Uncharacterized protein n=1 Tax=Paenactinomyces guangxiensis TaxID=1490290 RepID=A0A7W1WS99_9BACL|nr:hypothetical protein [Paenactinomyces guangxiensis]MBA4494921.1 hypothetical protein [Paenactinomyces guangxiensis]MBH8592004.1 hypothetical protein [Paenactinomyces guangxiensis]